VDELIRALRPGTNAALDLEERTEAELDRMKARYQKLAEDSLTAGKPQDDAPRSPNRRHVQKPA
jgi:hypothetical protein